MSGYRLNRYGNFYKSDKHRPVFPAEEAKKVLGLTSVQARKLFYADNWPVPFRSFNPDLKTSIARIQHFIDTKGRE